MVRVRALEVETERGLRVRQPAAQSQRNALEVGVRTGGHRLQKSLVGVGIHLSEMVVRKSLGIGSDPVGVELLLAVVRMVRLSPLLGELGGVDPDLLGLLGSLGLVGGRRRVALTRQLPGKPD